MGQAMQARHWVGLLCMGTELGCWWDLDSVRWLSTCEGLLAVCFELGC